jgi:hypothetical protein
MELKYNLNCLNSNRHQTAYSERDSAIKNRRKSIKLLLIEMSDCSKHRQLKKNGDNPGGRTLRSLLVLIATEGTLNIIRGATPFSKY